MTKLKQLGTAWDSETPLAKLLPEDEYKEHFTAKDIRKLLKTAQDLDLVNEECRIYPRNRTMVVLRTDSSIMESKKLRALDGFSWANQGVKTVAKGSNIDRTRYTSRIYDAEGNPIGHSKEFIREEFFDQELKLTLFKYSGNSEIATRNPSWDYGEREDHELPHVRSTPFDPSKIFYDKRDRHKLNEKIPSQKDIVEQIRPDLEHCRAIPEQDNLEMLSDEESHDLPTTSGDNTERPTREHHSDEESGDELLLTEPERLGEPARPLNMTSKAPTKLSDEAVVRLHNQCKEKGAIYDIGSYSVHNPQHGEIYAFSTKKLARHEDYKAYLNGDGHSWKEWKRSNMQNKFSKTSTHMGVCTQYTRKNMIDRTMDVNTKKFVYNIPTKRTVLIHYVGNLDTYLSAPHGNSKENTNLHIPAHRIAKNVAKDTSMLLSPTEAHKQLERVLDQSVMLSNTRKTLNHVKLSLEPFKSNAAEELAALANTPNEKLRESIRLCAMQPEACVILILQDSLDEMRRVLQVMLERDPNFKFLLGFDTSFDMNHKYASSLVARHPYVIMKGSPDPEENMPAGAQGAIYPLAIIIHLNRSLPSRDIFFKIVENNYDFLRNHATLITDREFKNVQLFGVEKPILCGNHIYENMKRKAMAELRHSRTDEDVKVFHRNYHTLMRSRTVESFDDRVQYLFHGNEAAFGQPIHECWQDLRFQTYFRTHVEKDIKEQASRFALNEKYNFPFSVTRNPLTNNMSESFNAVLEKYKEMSSLATWGRCAVTAFHCLEDRARNFQKAYYRTGDYRLLNDFQHLCLTRKDLPPNAGQTIEEDIRDLARKRIEGKLMREDILTQEELDGMDIEQKARHILNKPRTNVDFSAAMGLYIVRGAHPAHQGVPYFVDLRPHNAKGPTCTCNVAPMCEHLLAVLSSNNFRPTGELFEDDVLTMLAAQQPKRALLGSKTQTPRQMLTKFGPPKTVPAISLLPEAPSSARKKKLPATPKTPRAKTAAPTAGTPVTPARTRIQFTETDIRGCALQLPEFFDMTREYSLPNRRLAGNTLNVFRYFEDEQHRPQIFVTSANDYTVACIKSPDFRTNEFRDTFLTLSKNCMTYAPERNTFVIRAIMIDEKDERKFFQTAETIVKEKSYRKDRIHTFTLPCICGSQRDGNEVQCLQCKNTFHTECVGTTEEVRSSFTCDKCDFPLEPLRWGHLDIRNSCTIDNFLTGISATALTNNTLRRLIENTDVILAQVVTNFEDKGSIQDLWLRALMHASAEDRNFPRLDSPRDLFGESDDRFFSLINGTTWQTARPVCQDCGQVEEWINQKMFFLTDLSIDNTLLGVTHDSDITCHHCDQDKPFLPVRDSEENWGMCFNIQAFQPFADIRPGDPDRFRQTLLDGALPAQITFQEKTFEKSIIEIRTGAHFTSFIKFRQTWFHYDDLRQRNRLIPLCIKGPDDLFPPEVLQNLTGHEALPIKALYLRTA